MRITVDVDLPLPGLDVPCEWIESPSGNDATTGSVIRYNKFQFATKEAAENLAKLLGAEVEAITYAVGPFSMKQPMYLLNFPNGNSGHSAGLLLKALSDEQKNTRNAIRDFIRNVMHNPTVVPALSLPRDPLAVCRERWGV